MCWWWRENSNEFETECKIIFGLKPSYYTCGKCDIELKIITVGRIGSGSSPFGQWFCVPCLSAINKKWIGPRKRKLIDYCVSSERTQQRWTKTLQETTISLATSETSVTQFVNDIFNVNRKEDNILSKNISSTLKLIQKYFSSSKHKSIACLLTDKIQLDISIKIDRN